MIDQPASSPLQEFSTITRSSISITSLRQSLERSSFEGDLTRAKSTLQTWNTSVCLPPPSPIDLTAALHLAIVYGHLSIVRLLLDHGATHTLSTSALAARADKPNTLAIFETLLDHGWSVQSTASKDGTMAMCLIMSNPDGEELLKWFLDHGAPADGLSSDPGAPLRAAPNAAIAAQLLGRGAVLKHTSALHEAVRRHDDADALPLMKLLLDHEINVDELEYEGRDRLPRVAAHRDHGTALHVAAQMGSVERAKLLVERGADLAKKSRYGYTARDRAQIEGKEDVKTYLEMVMRQKGMEVLELDEEEEEEEDE